jgi:hypothetical protein
MADLQLIEGRYQEALELTKRAQELTSRHLNTWTRASSQRGIAYLGLGKIDDAVLCMQLPLSRMIEEHWTSMLRNLLAFAGPLLAEWGEPAWAAALIAHGLTHPHTPGRCQVDPLIQRYRAELEETLGAERFAAAWARGEQLDTLEAAAEVLTRLESAD